MGAEDALPPVRGAPEPCIPMKPLPSCLQRRRTAPASWQARRTASEAGRGTIRKISLAPSLASVWCQCTGRLRGGGAARCCWDRPQGLGDSRVPSLILGFGYKLHSFLWRWMSRLGWCRSLGFREVSAQRETGVRRDVSSGFGGRCRSGDCRTLAEGKGQARSHLPALGNVGRCWMSNTGC